MRTPPLALLQSLQLLITSVCVHWLQDIIQQSTKGEVQVARLDSAARQMAAFAQSNRLRQLASLMVARNSPAEELQELRELFSGDPPPPYSPAARSAVTDVSEGGMPAEVKMAQLSFCTQKLAVMLNSRPSYFLSDINCQKSLTHS